MKNELGKAIATICLAFVCIAWMHYTKGISGIGWFILGVFLIYYY
jgi:hypothetical protein